MEFRYCKLCNKLVYNYTELTLVYRQSAILTPYGINSVRTICKCLKCFSKNRIAYDKNLSSIHIQECKVKEFIINNEIKLTNIIGNIKYNIKQFDYIRCIDRFYKLSNDDIIYSLIKTKPLLLYWYKDRSEEFEVKAINLFIISGRYDLIKEHLLFEGTRNYLKLMNL